LARSINDLAVRDRHHVVDVPVDDRQRQLRDAAGGDAVGDGVDGVERLWRPLRETVGNRRRALRLNPDDARVRL
jgi:hypothetical protein